MATPTFSLKELEDDPRLFLYTSLTAGSSHIITATSRMETILKANRIPFLAIDIATDEKARRLWQRRAGQRKLPGLVKAGFVVGDLNEVEEWNEFGELKEAIGPVPASSAPPPAGGQAGFHVTPPSLPVIPTATQGTTKLKQPVSINKAPQPGFDKSKAIRLPGAEELAARHKEKAAGGASTSTTTGNAKPETMTSSAEQKKESVEAASAAGNAPDTALAPATTSTTEAPKPETMTSSPDDKKKSIEEAKKSATADSDIAEASQPSASTATTTGGDEETAPAKSNPATESKETSADEKAETAAPPTTKTGDAESNEKTDAQTDKKTEAATQGVAALKVDNDDKVEGQKTQEQSATDPEKAAKSVED